MQYSLADNNNTIIALSTPNGSGAIAMIRLSGENAITLTDDLFKGKLLRKQPSHTLHYGRIVDGEETIDEVVIGLYKGPNSYTKQDVVEISCHGSDYIVQRILDLCIKHGARLAMPGEFTMRAFLNGGLDLSQAEAVGDLIAATSAAEHKMALNQLRGNYSNQIAELRQKLIDFASLVELELDFGEEDVEFADRKQLFDLVSGLLNRIESLIKSFRYGNALKKGVPTVIAGRPNAGKSTLLNALLGENRAIVSDIAGTTRDTIEENLVIEGINFRLIDTAGIRDANDKIEAIGIERTFEKIKQSSIIVYLFDAKQLNEEELRHDIQHLAAEKADLVIIANKVDIASNYEHLADTYDNILFISAKNETNISLLKRHLVETVKAWKVPNQSMVVNNMRHVQAFSQTAQALKAVQSGLTNHISGDFLAQDIREALHHLGSITGEISTDDLLGNIFSNFCIGK